MGKKNEKSRREELKEMSLFRLKRLAVSEKVDPDLVRDCTDDAQVIDLIIEKEFGGGGGEEETPKRTPKKGKEKDKEKEEKPKPKEKDDDDEGDGDEGDGDDGDGDEGDDGDDGDEGGDDDDGDDDGDGDDGDDEEDEKPARRAVKKDDDEQPLTGIKELDEKLDKVLTKVSELSADLDGVTRFIAATYHIVKSGLPIIGKVVGTKGLTKKIEEIVEKYTKAPKESKDKEED